jgi:4-oxalocrotonate tautomerase family enzyme
VQGYYLFFSNLELLFLFDDPPTAFIYPHTYSSLIKMPVVTISTWTGKTVEQKDKLMKGITKAFKDIGVDPTGLTIIIHDIPRYNWGKGGEQVSKEA